MPGFEQHRAQFNREIKEDSMATSDKAGELGSIPTDGVFHIASHGIGSCLKVTVVGVSRSLTEL